MILAKIYGFWFDDWVFSWIFGGFVVWWFWLEFMDFGLMIGFSLRFVDDLWSNWCYVVLLLMLDDLDVLLLIWLGFGLLVLEICLGWNSVYLVEFVLWEVLEKKIFEYYVLRSCELGLFSCNLDLSSCLFMFFLTWFELMCFHI